MREIEVRLRRLQAYIDRRRGVPLRILYHAEGEERSGTVDDMIADHGAFARVLGGSSLEDLDRMLKFEMENIHVIK